MAGLARRHDSKITKPRQRSSTVRRSRVVSSIINSITCTRVGKMSMAPAQLPPVRGGGGWFGLGTIAPH